MVDKEEHWSNAYFLIVVTDAGIVIWVNDEQLPKKYSPMMVIDEGTWNVICSNDEQSLKDHFPNDVTEEGIVIFINEEHS